MRKPLLLSLVLLLALAAIAAAAAGGARAGTVTKIDDATKTFTVHGHHNDWTFKANDKTTYWLGAKTQGSWSDLKVGTNLRVVSHEEGGESVADKVHVLPDQHPGEAHP
jgi:Cu/Ag efflux protein CusF